MIGQRCDTLVRDHSIDNRNQFTDGLVLVLKRLMLNLRLSLQMALVAAVFGILFTRKENLSVRSLDKSSCSVSSARWISKKPSLLCQCRQCSSYHETFTTLILFIRACHHLQAATEFLPRPRNSCGFLKIVEIVSSILSTTSSILILKKGRLSYRIRHA